jgi:hypothetical protein
VRTVRVFSAPSCHLCDAALAVVDDVRAETPFVLEVVDITGDADLEARYRELIPVVEIDGVPAFTYFVQPDALRRALHR